MKMLGLKLRLILAYHILFYLFANSCFNTLQHYVTQAIIIAETKRLYLCVATHLYSSLYLCVAPYMYTAVNAISFEPRQL